MRGKVSPQPLQARTDLGRGGNRSILFMRKDLTRASPARPAGFSFVGLGRVLAVQAQDLAAGDGHGATDAAVLDLAVRAVAQDQAFG